ncbi:YveK family protein [Tessaracoccus caeni]|uniref:YveK family protein n=1 Tax=Tessaracoccus caeni TaxID=3031239 RepID=UPI0023DA1993|nr:hypothetical protein [Tessaracoccus caeni]
MTDLLMLVVRRWWVLTLSLVLGVGLGWGALQVVAPTYTATATQLVKGIPGATTGANYIAAQYAVARAKSYPVFIYSSEVLDGVRKDLGEQYSDADLRSMLKAANPVDTPLVHVTAEGGSPEEAKSLADSAAKHLATFIEKIETIEKTSPVVLSTAVDAELPTKPTSPSRLLFLAMGAALGFTIGLLVVLAWGAFANQMQARRAQQP